ncbi:MAG: YdeI/OmpD-associated family protein [Planctomycetales bacterium]|nr:YdeI/OmpD-associated family protein [Planctomycetales bacterium]
MNNKSNLEREIQEMPEFVRIALQQRSLMVAYDARPAYQQNDYIGWINRAKLDATKQKRLNQMLDELERGGVYMKMEHSPSRKN